MSRCLALTAQFHGIFPGTGTSTLVPVPVFAVPAVPLRYFSEQRHRLAEYYFAPRELNIPANFPELISLNILPCLKSLAWKDFRRDGYRGRVYSSLYPGKYSTMELGCYALDF